MHMGAANGGRRDGKHTRESSGTRVEMHAGQTPQHTVPWGSSNSHVSALGVQHSTICEHLRIPFGGKVPVATDGVRWQEDLRTTVTGQGGARWMGSQVGWQAWERQTGEGGVANGGAKHDSVSQCSQFKPTTVLGLVITQGAAHIPLGDGGGVGQESAALPK